MNFTKTEMYMDTSKVTRFELITENGRSVVEYNCDVELSLQDDGTTLKVFLKRREQEFIPVIEDLDETTSQPIGFKFRYKNDILIISKVEDTYRNCKGCKFESWLACFDSCFAYRRFNRNPIIFKQIKNDSTSN